jgi:ParB family transcriptional regulator, chromosome partitioning protein
MADLAPHVSLLGGSAEFEDVRLEELDVATQNVRRRSITAGVNELAESLARIGQQQPIVVQQDGDRFTIVIGQRRYLAAKQLGWQKIKALVLQQPLSDLNRAIISLSENIQRRDLEPEDKAAAIEYLRRELGTVKAVAEWLGASEVTVRKWLGYGAVPEAIKQLVEERQISVPTAIRITQHVTDQERAIDLARRVAEIAPTSKDRDRLLTAVEDYGDRPVSVILEKAAEAREQVEIHFILPERWSRAIEEAARQQRKQPVDIAREATIEWLESRQY